MGKTPTTLIIMDGFGLTQPGPGNAVSLANTPVLDRLWADYAHTTLSASGLDVGLPEGQIKVTVSRETRATEYAK